MMLQSLHGHFLLSSLNMDGSVVVTEGYAFLRQVLEQCLADVITYSANSENLARVFVKILERWTILLNQHREGYHK